MTKISKRAAFRRAVVFLIEALIIADAFYHFLKIAALLLKWAGVM